MVVAGSINPNPVCHLPLPVFRRRPGFPALPNLRIPTGVNIVWQETQRGTNSVTETNRDQLTVAVQIGPNNNATFARNNGPVQDMAIQIGGNNHINRIG